VLRPSKSGRDPSFEPDVQLGLSRVRKAREVLAFGATPTPDKILNEGIPPIRVERTPGGFGKPLARLLSGEAQDLGRADCRDRRGVWDKRVRVHGIYVDVVDAVAFEECADNLR
jgi:hypothetical protein